MGKTQDAELEALKAELAAARAELDKIARKKAEAKAKRKSHAKKDLDPAATEAKVKFETIDYAPEGTILRDVQDKGRPAHVYAFYKLVKKLSFDRMPRLIVDLASEVTGGDEAAMRELLENAFTRVPKAKPKEPAGETGEETGEG